MRSPLRRRSGVDPAEQPVVRKIASILLRYPDDTVFALLDDVGAAAAGLSAWQQSHPLCSLAERLAERGALDAAQGYVATFDLTRRCSPYLTYYHYGDTRNRGMALLALKRAYRRGGWELCDGELPDHLPTMLEFASLVPEQGAAMLATHRQELELLRLALTDAGSDYATVLDAVCAGLPGLTSRQLDRVRAWAENGPPREDVGLDPIGTQPFAPPEYLTGQEQR